MQSFAGTTLDPSRGPSVSEMTWLTSYQDVDEAFKAHEIVQGGGGLRDSEPFVGHGLLSLSGDEHFERRRIEAVLFRRAALERYQDAVLAPALHASLATCERGADGLARGDLQRLLRLALCRVSAALVGIDGVETPAVIDEYLSYMDRLSMGTNIEWASGDHREIIRVGRKLRAEFDTKYIQPSLRRREALVAEYRAGGRSAEQLPTDLLTVIVLHKNHFTQHSSEAMVSEVVLFNGATTGTITQAVPHVIAELSEWLAAHPEDRARVEDRQFLRRAVIEGIRLHPASPYLIRQATAGKQLRSGRRLVAGEYVVLDLVKSSRDAAVFAPDPDRFDPHRVPKVRIRPMGLTFGDGPHTCIGMSMTIGDGGAADEDAPLGFAVYLVREFYRAGIYVDPADPPRWNDANVRNEYAAFPVRFDNLAR
jgi:cytochrome P450